MTLWRRLYSAGAMLIFSVSFLIDQTPEGEELGKIWIYIGVVVVGAWVGAEAQGNGRHVMRASKRHNKVRATASRLVGANWTLLKGWRVCGTLF